MNKSVKKILIIFIPVFVLLITLSIVFGTKYSSKASILSSTSDSEYVTYHTNSITSIESPDSTPSNPIIQVKVNIELTNKCKFGVGTFDILLQFTDENDEIWEKIIENVTLNGANTNISFTEIKTCTTESLTAIGIKLHGDDFVAVTHDEQYENYYGKNNVIVSENDVNVFSTLTLIFSAFTLIEVSAYL